MAAYDIINRGGASHPHEYIFPDGPLKKSACENTFILKMSAWKNMIFLCGTLCSPPVKIMPTEKISKAHPYLLLHHPYPLHQSFPSSSPLSLSLFLPGRRGSRDGLPLPVTAAAQQRGGEASPMTRRGRKVAAQLLPLLATAATQRRGDRDDDDDAFWIRHRPVSGRGSEVAAMRGGEGRGGDVAARLLPLPA